MRDSCFIYINIYLSLNNGDVGCGSPRTSSTAHTASGGKRLYQVVMEDVVPRGCGSPVVPQQLTWHLVKNCQVVIEVVALLEPPQQFTWSGSRLSSGDRSCGWLF